MLQEAAEDLVCQGYLRAPRSSVTPVGQLPRGLLVWQRKSPTFSSCLEVTAAEQGAPSAPLKLRGEAHQQLGVLGIGPGSMMCWCSWCWALQAADMVGLSHAPWQGFCVAFMLQSWNSDPKPTPPLRTTRTMVLQAQWCFAGLIPKLIGISEAIPIASHCLGGLWEPKKTYHRQGQRQHEILCLGPCLSHAPCRRGRLWSFILQLSKRADEVSWMVSTPGFAPCSHTCFHFPSFCFPRLLQALPLPLALPAPPFPTTPGTSVPLSRSQAPPPKSPG